MNNPNIFTFQEILPSHLDLPVVIALSLGNPTPRKVEQVLDSYRKPNHHLIGCCETNKLSGMIGLEVGGAVGVIKHIAVLPEYRLQGIAKALIKNAIAQFDLQIIHAETDDDAVDFYKKYGFTCQSFEGLYGKRYKCDYKV